MKDKLTPEQSQRLMELGVDPSKASWRTEIYEPINSNYRWESVIPTFDFFDILKILPKEINGIELGMKYNEGLWCVYYKTLIIKSSSELIDALFEMLVWVLKNHPDKIKTSER